LDEAVKQIPQKEDLRKHAARLQAVEKRNSEAVGKLLNNE
jgi:hypothetical protein